MTDDNQTPEPTIEVLQAQVASLAAEVETWKGHARKHEDRAKRRKAAQLKREQAYVRRWIARNPDAIADLT